MKHNRNPLFEAVHYALGVGVVAGLAMTAAPVFAQDQDDEEDAADLGRVQVTGSRLSRPDIEGATPVVTLDRDDIDATGYQSVADVLRYNSFNVFGSLREASGNTAQGQAVLSLRGIGSNRTLVLLNGRRMPGSPVLDAQIQNLNAVPFAAVERIEILSDGASAVYGSDAIGGVVNIILRSDYQGAEATYRREISDREGGDEELISLVGGISGDRGNITYSIEHNEKDIIWTRDRPFTRAQNIGASEYTDTFGISTASRNFLTADSGYGLYVPMSDNCQAYGENFSGVYTNAQGIEGSEVCGYNHTASSAMTAALEQTNIFMDANYEVTNNIDFWSRAQFSEVESFGRYAPAAGGFFSPTDLPEETLADGTTLTPISAGDYILYRFDNTGPSRDTTQRDYMVDLQAGLSGYHAGMDWELSYQRNTYRLHEWGDGYVNALGAADALRNGWDPRHPNQEQFGDLVAGMRENANRRAELVTDRIDVGVQFDGPQLTAAGPMSFFVGSEYREESYFDQTQAQGEAGNIIGTAGGTSGGARDVFAAYAEANLPITDSINLDAAVRYDDYSDFGTNVSGKIAARWQPTQSFLVRGSYGTGFRAPSLDQLFQAPAQSFAFADDIANCMGGTISQVQGNAGFADDLSACLAAPNAQHQTFFGANENLDAEESEQANIGFVFDFSEMTGMNLSTSLDYYWIEITDQITGISAQDIMWLQFLEQIDGAAGVEYNSPGGQPTPHVSRPTNFEDFDTSGLDLNVDYQADLGGMGQFSSNLRVSYVLEYNSRFTILSEQQDYTDLTLNEWRADLSLGYSLGNHEINWLIQHVPGYCENTTLDTSTLEDVSLLARCTTDGQGNQLEYSSWTNHNIHYNYHTPWNGTVTLGVNNVGDRMPPLASDGATFDLDQYPLVGRQYVVQYRQRF